MRLNNLLLLVLFPLIAVGVVSQFYIFVSIPARVTAIFGTSSNVAFATTIFSLFYASGYIIWGYVANLFGKKKVMIGGLILLAAVTVAIGFCTNYKGFLFLRGVQGLFASTFPAMAILSLSENLENNLKYVGISLLSCGFLLAGSVGQQLGIIFIKDSFYTIMMAFSIIYIIGSVYILFFIKERAIASVKSVNLKGYWYVFTDKKLFPAYLAAFLVLGSFISFYTSVKMDSKISDDTVLMYQRLALVGFLSSTVAFVFIKRFGVVKTLIAGVSITGLLQGITAALLHLNIGFILPIHFISSVAIGITVPSLITYMGEKSGDRRVFATSLYVFVLFIGAGLSPIITAKLGSLATMLGQCFILLLSAYFIRKSNDI